MTAFTNAFTYKYETVTTIYYAYKSINYVSEKVLDI